jgi:DNA-binding response OmpR family regulator
MRDLLPEPVHAAGFARVMAATRASQPVALHGDDSACALAWCEALRAEGIDIGAARADVPPRALVLYGEQRLPEQLAALRELRAREPALPLLVVCPGLRELDQILALEMGADDAIDACTGAAVVAARLRALWRRGPDALMAADRLHFGRLSLWLRERRVQLGERPIALTECEFEVLWLLALQAGRAISRTELLERLRGLPYQRIDRSIDSRIYRIRAKLGDAAGTAQRIRTVRNCGYLFSPERW